MIEKWAGWQGNAVLLFERWKWQPSEVNDLELEEFSYWVARAEDMYKAEADAIKKATKGR